jgi:hypothetical protein
LGEAPRRTPWVVLAAAALLAVELTAQKKKDRRFGRFA